MTLETERLIPAPLGRKSDAEDLYKYASIRMWVRSPDDAATQSVDESRDIIKTVFLWGRGLCCVPEIR